MMKVTGEGRSENSQTIPLPPYHSHIVDSNSQFIDLRVYQAWPGSNIFCFGGRLIFGPDVRSLFLAVFLILVPVILFCSFVSQEIRSEFQPYLGNVIVGISFVFTAYVLVLLFVASSSDPGIIPRSPYPPEDDGSISTNWPSIHGGSGPSLPVTKDVMVNGMIVKVKYCPTCMLYRPPRCSHCSICNNCVERFDHHCPWVGQCIGKRNYRFFFMFVSSTTMLCLYVFALCCVNIRKIANTYQCNIWRALLKSPFSGILILYTFICAWFVGGLTSFHLYLICTNQTTYENFRRRYDRKKNPYNLGCVRNTIEILFSKIPKSKNDFRAKVRVDSFQVYDSSPSHSWSPMITETSLDIEVGKRKAVADEDFEEIRSHMDGGGASERCPTQPRHKTRDHDGNRETAVDMRMLASEFEMEHSLEAR